MKEGRKITECYKDKGHRPGRQGSAGETEKEQPKMHTLLGPWKSNVFKVDAHQRS